MPQPPITAEQMRTLGRREWLLTSGLGGFASGCASGVPERRYHALLIAGTAPPVGRVVGLSAVAETLIAEVETPRGVSRERSALSSFSFRGWEGQFAPLPVGFQADATTAAWTYAPWGARRGVQVRRELTLVEGRHAAELVYRVESPGRAWLELCPLVALRDFHQLVNGHRDGGRYHVEPLGTDGLLVRADSWTLRLRCPGAQVRLGSEWWWNFEYRRDRERGQDCVEDLFCPGTFSVEAGAAPVRLVAWMDEEGEPQAGAGQERRSRLERRAAAMTPADASEDEQTITRSLVEAADQFIARRDLGAGRERRRLSTVIAGFPWFSDWGRDTMIALPGLLLTTGRHDEARAALLAFGALQQRGLVPNCFDDAGGKPQFNTVDASLWFVHACFEYLRASGDRGAFMDGLLPACLEVVRAYREGTDFEIRVDPADGLVSAGDPGIQLTWMDAARDGVVFTPRNGKAVEINALWHSGLRRLAVLLRDESDPRAAALESLAQLAAESLRTRFWDGAGMCLYDRLAPSEGGWAPVAEVRPNQIFAVSLPHSPLSPAQQRAVVECVGRELLTPVGLRSLAPGHSAYRPRYEGNLFERDGAYHNGTVWPYLIGPYAEAVLRLGKSGPEAKREARSAVLPLARAARGDYDGVGPYASICEVYDAEEPRRCEGCPMQAWSVAEVLRLWVLTRPGGA